MRAKATADRASARPPDAYRRIPFRCSSRADTWVFPALLAERDAASHR
jgi:hypothetical protein